MDEILEPELEDDLNDNEETPVKKKRKNRRKKNRRKKKEAETGQDGDASNDGTDAKDKGTGNKTEGGSHSHNGKGDSAQEDGVHLFSNDGVTTTCPSDADFEEYLKHFELRLNNHRWHIEPYLQQPDFSSISTS
jgi:hypothetical protein